MYDMISDFDKMEQKRIDDANKKMNKDSQDRLNIHNLIKNMLLEGKNEVEILTCLNNKYPNTYLSKYFSRWIEFHLEKKDYMKNDRNDLER